MSHSTETAQTACLDFREKKTKKKSACQAYSALYYDSKVKPVVTERWNKILSEATSTMTTGDNPAKALPKSAPIAFCNQVTAEMFKEESDDVKAEVEKFRNGGGANENDEIKVDADEIERVAKAKAIQKSVNHGLIQLKSGELTQCDSAQNALPSTMVRVLSQIEREAGMIGCVVFIGPEPQRGGDLKTLTLVSLAHLRIQYMLISHIVQRI
jgi:hypothetical protein